MLILAGMGTTPAAIGRKAGNVKRRKYPVTMYHGTRIRYITDRDCWHVDYTALGKQDRKRFPTLAKAKTYVDQKDAEIKNKGQAAFGLGDRDRLDVTDARQWLGTVSLSTVFDFWRTHHPIGERQTVEQVMDAFLDAPGRRGKKIVERREATTEGHRKRLLSFGRNFGAHMAHEVGQGAIEQWLDVNGWRGLNRRHYLASVRALFAFAVRKQYVATNPAAGIELPDAAAGEPDIMTVEAVEKYLAAIEANCPDLLPREALAFFCGLRPEELTRLDWRNVSVENALVTVGGDVAKVQGHRRNVEMPANLLAWLAPYVRVSGPVWPYTSATTLHRKRAEARKAAGVDVPDNAGRHAFASYHLAANDNAPMTAERMGHANVKLLRNVYRNITAADGKPITKAAGEAYFNIMPKREAGATVIPFSAAS
jgi:integrase